MKKGIFVIVFFLCTSSLFASINKCVHFYDNHALFPSYQMVRPTEQITVECWVKAESYLNWGAPVSCTVDNSYDESGFALAFNKGKMRFMLKTLNMKGQEWTYNPGVVLEYNQWCHIAGVYDGKSIKFYLNGVLREERFVTGMIDWSHTPDQLCIGAFIDSNEMHPFSGCVDELRIWNRALSSIEIKDGMTSELSGEEDGLVMYCPMSGNGDVISDYSKNKLDGRIIGYSDENRKVSLAMVRPIISNLELLNTSSCKISWSVFNQAALFKDFYIDVARDSKFNSIISGFENLKSKEPNYTLTNIPGGNNLYVRIKGKANDGELTAYSVPYVIKDFSTSLTIDLYSKGGQEENHFVIINENILTSQYHNFKQGANSIVMQATIDSKIMSNEALAKMHIEGEEFNESYDITRVSNLIFPNLKAGEYHVRLAWGPNNLEKLSTEFVVEIEDYWWQNFWFKLNVFVVLILLVYLWVRNYVVLKKTKYHELIDGFVPIPEKEISEEEVASYYNLIIELMEGEKPFLEPRLNLKILGDMLDIPTSVLSQVIHEKSDLYFNDFINKYRIEEVKKILKSKDSENLKITAIAYDCGFNSESTFFRVFKKYTGQTPSSYQKNLKPSK